MNNIKNVKKFIIRGASFAWRGPFILAIVWAVLRANGKIDALTVNEVVLASFLRQSWRLWLPEYQPYIR